MLNGCMLLVVRGQSSASQRGPRLCAFTLLELLITMALILVMFVMLHGHGSRSHQMQQKEACQKNLRTIYLALQVFATDHDSKFPKEIGAQNSEKVLSELVPKYTSITAPFICPGSKDNALPEGEPFANRKISYAYYMGRLSSDNSEALVTDEQVNTLTKLAGQQIFSTDGNKPGNNHHKYGGNILFCDGRAENSGPLTTIPLVLSAGVVLLNPKW